MPSDSEQVKKSWITRHAPLGPKTVHVCSNCGNEKAYPEDFALQKDSATGNLGPARCKQCHRKLGRKNYNRLKSDLFSLLGNKCNWTEGCDWTDPRVLQLDHIEGGGGIQRRTIGMHKLYRQARDNPIGFQLLCANHNWIKRHLNNETSGKIGRGGRPSALKVAEPKEIRICRLCNQPKQYPDEFGLMKTKAGKIWVWCCLACDREYQKEKRLTHRDKVFSVLGNQCTWAGCGIIDRRVLQIDHIKGGGRKEIRALGGSYAVILRAIKHPEDYQVLCANHNCIKKYMNANEHSAYGFGEVA